MTLIRILSARVTWWWIRQPFFHFHLFGSNCAIVHHLEVSADGWTTFIPMKIVSTENVWFFFKKSSPPGGTCWTQRTRGVSSWEQIEILSCFTPETRRTPCNAKRNCRRIQMFHCHWEPAGQVPKKKKIYSAQFTRSTCPSKMFSDKLQPEGHLPERVDALAGHQVAPESRKGETFRLLSVAASVGRSPARRTVQTLKGAARKILVWVNETLSSVASVDCPWTFGIWFLEKIVHFSQVCGSLHQVNFDWIKFE